VPSDIAKRAIVVVAVEPVPKRWIVLYQTRNRGTVGKKNIQKSIVVEVEKGYSTKGGIDDRLVWHGAVPQHKAYAGRRQTALEANW